MSRLLLDTQAFLWWVTDDARLSAAARSAIADPNRTPVLSLASVWEMAIKAGIGQLRLTRPVTTFVREQLAANHFRLLPIELADFARVEGLPHHHRDPFDRLLIAQAMQGGFPIVSSDKTLDAYDVVRIG